MDSEELFENDVTKKNEIVDPDIILEKPEPPEKRLTILNPFKKIYKKKEEAKQDILDDVYKIEKPTLL